MKLLFVNCCISRRGAGSRTHALAEEFLAAFRAAHTDAQAEQITPDALARQCREADAVVVAAPFWDLSYPAALRTYIEYISAVGLTYRYTEAGCCGDCAAQWLVYLTSGGDVEREESVGVVHWRQLTAMFGIGRFDYVFGGGLDLDPGKAPELVSAAAELARRLGAEA